MVEDVNRAAPNLCSSHLCCQGRADRVKRVAFPSAAQCPQGLILHHIMIVLLDWLFVVYLGPLALRCWRGKLSERLIH